MTTIRPEWETRLDWILTVLLWTAFGLGLFLSVAEDGQTGTTVAAGIAVAGYTVVMQVVPRQIRNTDNVGELLAVSGVLVALFAVALTDGIESPYLLFLATPSFFAGGSLGYRIGVETALLTSAGLISVVAILDQEILQGQVLQVVLLYILISATFAQARRVLVEERARRDELTAASELSAKRAARLEAAHSALVSLQELADAADLNPVTVGRAALRDLALLAPYESGQVILTDDIGPVVVARRGVPGPPEDGVRYPIQVGDRVLGHLSLWPENGQEPGSSRAVVEEVLRPVSLAFDNIALLRTIAKRAVQEERTRLARGLHDDIGPSLASLGLGIDMAIHQHETGVSLARHLEAMRRSVTSLVDNIRYTAADLRHEPVTSLVEQAHRLAAAIGADAPAVLVDIDERRPPRPSIAGDLGAIMAEAVRNAVEHADARLIRIEGHVDHDQGTLSVADDGRGFDLAVRPAGHFGLTGMEERAEEIGARLEIASDAEGGTRVTVGWGT
jgi:signal transduction histidine kinase